MKFNVLFKTVQVIAVLITISMSITFVVENVYVSPEHKDLSRSRLSLRTVFTARCT